MSNDLSSQGDLPPSIKKTGLSLTVSAPGKVILHGEHSVVYGKLAIAASLNLRTNLTITEIDDPDNGFVVRSSNMDIIKTFSLQAIKKHLLEPPLQLNGPDEEFCWEHPDLVHHQLLLDRVDDFLMDKRTADLDCNQLTAIKSLLYLLVGLFASVDIELRPVFIDVSTGLNIGAGTGSSASYLVSVSAAFIQHMKLKAKSGNISKTGYKPSTLDTDLEKFSMKELEMICGWAYCAEKIVHGTPSGLDNSICTYGHVLEFRKDHPLKFLKLSYPFKMLLINTKVPRETKLLVSKVAQLHKTYPQMTNNILNAMDDVAVAAVDNMAAIADIEVSADADKGRLEVTHKRFEQLCQLSAVNHNLLSALGVSHIKLDEAVNLLARHGLRGKLTGAGGGGYAIALVPPYCDSVALDAAVKDLVNNGFGVTCTELGGQGVRIESSV